MTLRDVLISNASLGKPMLLVEVVPAYEYQDQKRTDKITGYRYVVCLVAHHLEKLSVRIDGPSSWSSPTASWKLNSTIWKFALMSLRAR